MAAAASRLAPIGAAALAALLCVSAIVYAHRESPRTLVSAHGLLHTSIAQRFTSASLRSAPPENPFFAGAPVPYYWVFQYCGARLGQLLGVHPLHAFECMILAAMCVLWLAAASLGHRLYGGIIPGLVIGLLAVGGTNPFGVPILLGKIALRGPAPLHDDPSHFWGLVHPVMSSARLNDPFNLYGPFINFFFNITSRPIALALVLQMALCTCAWLRQGSLAAWMGMALSAAVSTAFSVAIGAPAALSLSAALVVVSWLWPGGSGGSGRQLWRVRALWGGGGLVLGVGLAAPTYLHLFLGEAEREMQLDLSVSSMIRVGASAGLLVAMACVGALRHRGRNRSFLMAALIAGLGLVAAGTILELPVENHCNLFQAGAFLLAVPAVGSVVPSRSWPPTRVRLTWLAVVILFLPTPLLVMFSYLHRPPIALVFGDGRLDRVPADSPLARLYDWVRMHTAPDAVFILEPGPPFTTAVGNMPEFPALTERVQFTSYQSSYMVAPHRDADLRDAIARRLLAGEALDAGQGDYLSRLGRPLYLVVDLAHASGAEPALRQRFGEALFRDADMAVFTVDPARTMVQLPGASGPPTTRTQPAFSTYLGGSAEEQLRDVATDGAGNIYVAGGTRSANFPLTAGVYDTSHNGSMDVVVMKVDAAGERIEWATLLGGPNNDRAYAIELDAQGDVVVAGRAGAGFPTTAGVVQPQFGGDEAPNALYGPQDGFVAKLSADGRTLLWATYFGGADSSAARDMAMDAAGNVYLAVGGVAQPNALVPPNALQAQLVGGRGGIVAKLNGSGTQVVWATYVDGSGGADLGTPSIRVDGQGNVYVIGYTTSDDLRTTPGAYDRSYNGGGDLYVAKFAADGTQLLYGTYLGGAAVEFSETHGLAVDEQGQVIIAATTRSSDFPTTAGGAQPIYGGNGGVGTGAGTNYSGDGFVAKLSADGSRLVASTFVGGNCGDGIEGVSVDTQGNVYVSGATYSTNLPVTADAAQATNQGQGDLFAVKLSAGLSQVLYGTYLGGTGTDYGRASAVDPSGTLIVTGDVTSRDWPLRQPLQPRYSGGSSDGVLATIASPLGAAPSSREYRSEQHPNR